MKTFSGKILSPIVTILHFIASVLECSIYLCTSFEKNEFENFGILIFYMFFVRDIKSISEDEIIPIQIR